MQFWTGLLIPDKDKNSLITPTGPKMFGPKPGKSVNYQMSVPMVIKWKDLRKERLPRWSASRTTHKLIAEKTV